MRTAYGHTPEGTTAASTPSSCAAVWSCGSSTDLRRWTVEKEAISSNNCFFHGFQYVDWVFDGDDIIAVSRTAFPETRGLPARQHDANFLTFHRISNFRNAGFETEHIGYDQL